MKRVAIPFAFALAAAFSGCAPSPAPVIPPAPPSAASAAPSAPAPLGAGATPDSTPSPEALAVLATIPEPLGAAAPAPAPAGSAGAKKGAAATGAAAGVSAAAPKSVPAPPESFDSLRVDTQSAQAGDVPVPSPTQPLAPTAVAPAVAPPVAPPAAAAPAVPDTCWRVQIGAPAERDKGKALRDAAESLLMVPMIVDREGGRFKVRSRDYLSRESAESLRERATATGFKGVFLVRLPGTR